MTPFGTLLGVAAPMALDSVDSDMIVAKQFPKATGRSGRGKNLFDEMRCNCHGVRPAKAAPFAVIVPLTDVRDLV